MTETARPQAAVEKDHPLMVAWNAYKATEDYANSKKWALRIAPFSHGLGEDRDRSLYEIMPFGTRERHVEGSLWAMFVAGWKAAGGDV